MKLTKQFLLDNRTKSGAWTREQLRIIGVNWPPVKGWQSLVAGKELTGAEVAEFIRAKDKPGMSKTSLEKCYLGVMKGIKRLSKGQLVMLRDEINKEVR
ncbi:hypothetical protein OAP25_02130 [Flavobacteriaceae bacterium]|nr:hypothetical protein [Flavobacteriaceae bacterium]